ncbi:hypothetical protein D9M71_683790 [compost metagenome]
MPWQSCCSRLASSSAPSFRTKLEVPLRPSTQAFWLLPLVVMSAFMSSRPRTGGFCSRALSSCSTGTLLTRFCAFSSGTAGRASICALAW